jgi:hypothetical protein
MILENEVIQLIIGLGGLVFILINRQRLKRPRVMALLVAGFNFLLAAWVFTVLEGFIWPRLLNLLEHLSYFASSVLVLLWCIGLVRGKAAQ